MPKFNYYNPCLYFSYRSSSVWYRLVQRSSSVWYRLVQRSSSVWYRLVQRQSGKVLGTSTSSSSTLGFYTWNEDYYQQWAFCALGSYWTVVNRATGRYLDANSDVSTEKATLTKVNSISINQSIIMLFK